MREASFEETSASERVAGLPLAHLSIELGHLYMEDLAADDAHLIGLMNNVAPWVESVKRVYATQLHPSTPRISTCFLVDDYFTQLMSPGELIPRIVEASAAAGLQLDYLARESACVRADGVELALLVQDRLVADPPPNTNGRRPPTTTTGWLCNGERGPNQAMHEAMHRAPWKPPSENGAHRHSIFVDVQLWSEDDGGRTWSCPYLAAIWQLLRLGVLRSNGEPVTQPRECPQVFPAAWSALPPIMRLTERPAAFSAYRTFSVMPRRFLAIEDAVRVILGQFDVGQAMREQMNDRAAKERVVLPPELNDRIEYVFTGQPLRAGLSYA